MISEKIEDGRIGKMPESGDSGVEPSRGPLIFFPNDLEPAGPVKKSHDRGGKGR
jgi:hypothetical protein